MLSSKTKKKQENIKALVLTFRKANLKRHETGHISGGHIAGRTDALEAAQTQALIATILGLGAAVATGQGGLAAAGASTGQDLAIKGLFRYTRTQESAADQAAVNYLTATGQSPKGMLRFMVRHEMNA